MAENTLRWERWGGKDYKVVKLAGQLKYALVKHSNPELGAGQADNSKEADATVAQM